MGFMEYGSFLDSNKHFMASATTFSKNNTMTRQRSTE
jgi:hypothetical protein